MNLAYYMKVPKYEEKDLNIEYIQDKTGLVDNDELILIILEMIQESYKAGLCQSEYDNTMELIEELNDLKIKNARLKDNWNNLKKYIKTEIPEDVFKDTEWFVSILDKMKELEKGCDSNE